MRVKFSDFNKLKQLDRIEYLLKKDRIEKNYGYSLPSFNTLIWAFSFLVLLMLGWYTAFGSWDKFMPILNSFLILIKILVVIIFIDYAFYFVYGVLRGRYLKQLYDEFFMNKIEANKQ